jgi:PAS domain-containing protein
MVWLSGADGLRTFFNRAWLDYTGRNLTEAVGNGWLENVHPEKRERAGMPASPLRRVARPDQACPSACSMVWRNRQDIITRAAGKPHGALTYWVEKTVGEALNKCGLAR